MAEQANFTGECNLAEAYIEVLARYLSCNGEVIGIGPTLVFASAATLFLYSELGATFFSMTGDNVSSSTMEITLILTMLVGMLSLMVHLWVCSTRLFQYYMEAVVCESPMFLLEYTTGGLLGDKLDLIPVGPLTKFLRNQQPQIHITLCWFVALCYADYVRKNYCRRFNMPYLEQWQSRLQDRATRGMQQAIKSVNSFVDTLHDQLRSLTAGASPQDQQTQYQAPHNQFTPGPSASPPPPSTLPSGTPPTNPTSLPSPPAQQYRTQPKTQSSPSEDTDTVKSDGVSCAVQAQPWWSPGAKQRWIQEVGSTNLRHWARTTHYLWRTAPVTPISRKSKSLLWQQDADATSFKTQTQMQQNKDNFVKIKIKSFLLFHLIMQKQPSFDSVLSLCDKVAR